MIHHSLTDDGKTVSWAAIEEYHRRTQGWRDIGYHYGLELVGDHYFALVGRSEVMEAAACKEGRMNEKAIHICVVGNYDTIAPNVPQLRELSRRLMVPLMTRHGIHPQNIVAHRDYATYKSCPGTKFNLDDLRREIAWTIAQ